jgi:outer membrane protein assembly factor BamB
MTVQNSALVLSALILLALASPPSLGADDPSQPTGDWPQWGGDSQRNNAPQGSGIPHQWNPGQFSGNPVGWKPETAENIKWVANLGSQTYGNAVVADNRVFVGTNNSAGWLARYPRRVDLGCLLAFDNRNGDFLWQDSSEKLRTGRVHDWPLQGICCAPLVEGNRLWYVTSRGEVKCLDTEGFYDHEDDGVAAGWGRMFDLMKNQDRSLDQVEPAVKNLDAGQLDDTLRKAFASSGVDLPPEVAVTAQVPGKKWRVSASLAGTNRELELRLAGPKLSGFKQIMVADKKEADAIWVFDMMKELGISQHNMCSCSVTAAGDVLFVNTSNGVDESHILLPSPTAPSFIAMDKNTGEVLWTDNSPGTNILHGQWSSPAYGVLGGVPQVIFAGGDGWTYSFDPAGDGNGNSKLLWKFDCNPKQSKWELGGRGTRNNLIATPVIYDGLVYMAVGQDPEHAEGNGHLWCIDPTRRGDVSPTLAFHLDDLENPIAPRRIQAIDPKKGEVARDNPNSAVVWHYDKQDNNGDGEIDWEEEMHRSCGTVAIKGDLLYISDFSGLFHCLDAKTGKVHWTHDMLAAAWGSPLIVDGKVYIGDEDGDVTIFKLSSKKEILSRDESGDLGPINMGNSVYSTPIISDNVLYITNKTHLFAIAEEEEQKVSGEATEAE